VSAYAKLPALLERIGTLESGTALCRRRHCYGEAFSWLPYCETHLVPAPFRFSEPLGFDLDRYALMASFRIGYGLGLGIPASRSSLSPFVAITAC
jgi:hypothetical protein